MDEYTYSLARRINGLDSSFYIGLANDGRWMASTDHLSIAGVGVSSSVQGYGNDPEVAINQLWNQISKVPKGKRLRLHNADVPRYVEWDGYLWVDVGAPRV